MARNVVEAVGRDHDRLREMVRRLRTVSRGRESLLNQTRTLFVGHSRSVVGVLCPAACADSETFALQALADRVSAALDDLASSPATGVRPNAGARAADSDAFDRLQNALHDHVALSVDVLERLRCTSGPGRLEGLSAEYEHRRGVESSAVRHVRTTPRRLDLSRTELYEQARRAGISGRSNMTREQLIEALRTRSTTV
jgi:hypothetical protein